MTTETTIISCSVAIDAQNAAKNHPQTLLDVCFSALADGNLTMLDKFCTAAPAYVSAIYFAMILIRTRRRALPEKAKYETKNRAAARCCASCHPDDGRLPRFTQRLRSV